MPILKLKKTESLQLPRTEESGVKYKCRYCKRNFGQRRSQIRHEIHHCLWNPQKTKNSEFKTHVCENCGSSYTHRRTLLNHKRHDCGRNHQCKRCNRMYSELSNLKRHLRKGCSS